MQQSTKGIRTSTSSESIKVPISFITFVSTLNLRRIASVLGQTSKTCDSSCTPMPHPHKRSSSTIRDHRPVSTLRLCELNLNLENVIRARSLMYSLLKYTGCTFRPGLSERYVTAFEPCSFANFSVRDGRATVGVRIFRKNLYPLVCLASHIL